MFSLLVSNLSPKLRGSLSGNLSGNILSEGEGKKIIVISAETVKNHNKQSKSCRSLKNRDRRKIYGAIRRVKEK